MDPNFSDSDVELAGSEAGSIPSYEDSDSDSDPFDTACYTSLSVVRLGR
jgi:hypothetical protein